MKIEKTINKVSDCWGKKQGCAYPSCDCEQPATPTSEGKGETVEEIRAKAVKEYGDHPHLYAQQRDGYVVGYLAGLAHPQSLDIRRVLEYVAKQYESHAYLSDEILAMQPEIEKMLKEK